MKVTKFIFRTLNLKKMRLKIFNCNVSSTSLRPLLDILRFVYVALGLRVLMLSGAYEFLLFAESYYRKISVKKGFR